MRPQRLLGRFRDEPARCSGLPSTDHPQATNRYRLIGKIDETEYEIGSVGIACTELNPVWMYDYSDATSRDREGILGNLMTGQAGMLTP
jgi:hypothetical protein